MGQSLNMRSLEMLQTKDASRHGSQAGFTLIELSIVLVIIGLLVGGVLKGQELIAGTRIKATVAQADAIRAAVNTFQDRYRGIPGDMTDVQLGLVGLAGRGARQPTGGGLGNNVVGAPLGVAGGGMGVPIPAGVNAAASTFFKHLSIAELLPGVISPEQGVLTQYAGRLPGSFFAVGAFNITPQGGAGAAVRHFARLGGGTGYPATPLVAATETAELDRKYDDGFPDQGDVRSTVGGQCSVGGGVAGRYTANTGADCQIGFQLF